MASGAVKISKELTLAKAEGDQFRLLCLTGKNKGTSYFLSGKRAVMGRGDEADVQVLDAKSSRAHAELQKVGTGYIVTDLGSQNGIVVNDLKVTQHKLIDNDKIIIGQTVYKYSVIPDKAKTDLVEVDDEEDEDTEDETVKEKKKKGKEREKKSRKRNIMIIGALILIYVLMSGEETKKVSKKPVSDPEDITDTLNSVYKEQRKIEDKDTREKVQTFIHRGQREYREGNYFRAIEQLNLCLILAPNHGYCSFLLAKSKQRFDAMIGQHFDKAKIDVDALKYKSAMIEYCAVVKLLGEYKKAGKSDIRLEEAEANIEFVEKKLGMDPGEHKCF